MSSEPTASDICVQCGMCCNGALFDYGELEEHECGPVVDAGLAISRVNDKPRFHIPCSRLVDNVCTVYSARPGTCRTYKCQLLKKFEAGDVNGGEALERVREAQGLIARIKQLLPEGMDLARARTEWARTHKPVVDGNSSSPSAKPELTLSLFMLNRLLDRHFRKAHQRMMSDWQVDDGGKENRGPLPEEQAAPPS